MTKTHSSTITLCRYWVNPDKGAKLEKLLERHWPLFKELDLVLDDPPHQIFRGEDKERGIFYVETFPWKNPESMERAHSLAEVATIWESMAQCCTSMELPSVEQIEI